MNKVVQCRHVDFCENILSQDIYVECPKIHSTYCVNRDCKEVSSSDFQMANVIQKPYLNI